MENAVKDGVGEVMGVPWESWCSVWESAHWIIVNRKIALQI